MSCFVVATAGHVDHGKTTLIGALTGIDTDRWAEEKERGLTIDLGFAWTELDGDTVSFVDVPGHERFLGNMLAGLGPAPIVLFVVAADEGFQQQSADHRDAAAALGIDRGIIVITKTDRAPEMVDAVIEQTRAQLRGTGLEGAPAVAVSARTGDGIQALRAQMHRVLRESITASPAAGAAGHRTRLWIDRSFAISGAGTVITGTLGAGTLRTGMRAEIITRAGTLSADVRGLQSRERSVERLEPVNRAAVNLRGVSTDAIHRGDVLITPGAFHLTDTVDVRSTTAGDLTELPGDVTVHIGSAALQAHIRPFDAQHARITMPRVLPLVIGDRMVLRGSGQRAVLGGVRVMDVDPPALDRRGAGRRRAADLAALPERGSALVEVERRGAMRTEQLERFGLEVPGADPSAPSLEDLGLVADGGFLIARDRLDRWAAELRTAIGEELKRDPLGGGLPRGAALTALQLPDASLLPLVVRTAGVDAADGRFTLPGAAPSLGAAEASVAELERRLRAEPFAAPEAFDLDDLRLGPKELAAAQKQGRLLRIADGIVLLPTAPALAMRELAQLDQPFTASEARRALGTTRRVLIPLLEHLDGRGWTRRVDANRRTIVR